MIDGFGTGQGARSSAVGSSMSTVPTGKGPLYSGKDGVKLKRDQKGGMPIANDS